jgi:hypothetical protein
MEGDAKIKEAANTAPPSWCFYTAAYAAAATTATLLQPTPSCHRRVTAKLPLQSCHHCSHRCCAVAMLPPPPLPPLLRYRSRHQAAATAPLPRC